MSSWYRFTLQFQTPVSEDHWEIITALLLDAGAEGTYCEAFDEQLFSEAPREKENVVSETVVKETLSGHVYFQIDSVRKIESQKISDAKGSTQKSSDQLKQETMSLICETLEDIVDLPDYEVSYIEVDEDGWVELAKPHYHASVVSDRFIVGPPEERDAFPRESEDQKFIAIDFGPAFGTGTHPTTQLCLQLLEELESPPSSVLDLGTGTGVLCFASLLVGAEYAVGMDCLEKAKDQFFQNAQANKLEDQCDFIYGRTIEEAQMGCLLAGVPLPELILCNMLSTEFDEFLEPLSQWRKPMILSGFLEAEMQSVESRLVDTGWQITKRGIDRDWAAFICSPVT